MQLHWKRISLVLASAWVATLLFGLMMSLPRAVNSEAHADQQLRDRAATQNLNTAQDISSAFRNVAEVMRPSVVSISTQTDVSSRARQLSPNLRQQLPPGFEQFFGNGGRRGRSMEPQPQQQGQGSGVIVRQDGYILTNNHVVEGADIVTVELSTGAKVEAEVVGTDPETDLAVVKIDRTGLQPVPFGDSEAIRVGDWVLAIGSPFGLDQTVTAGIISGKNRVQGIVDDGHGFEDFLQTDAAINPGNSGGPLVNLHGELVGINTAILSRSGTSAGIGFAIPVALARPVFESIIENGEVRRGFLGAQVADVTPEVVTEFGLKVSKGALIRGVLEGQPAANAELQPGDVILETDGRPVTTSSRLVNYIASRAPGQSVQMKINRHGEELNVTVNLQLRTEKAMAMFSPRSPWGAELEPVTPQSAKEYGYADLQGGLIVTSVSDQGIAAEAGLQAGDVIETAAGRAVESVEQLTKILAVAKQQQVPLQVVVRRGNTKMLLVIR
ncbi:Do family serine endopeptidase [Allorhodopirellula heiligendammensis]|uniref:Periplasmic serine endoprotease DegP-like n=1 Tax=Allorhodopirellula heiligendammensis TaxID=2714739 RepID=A0A5C6BXL2_9BACT|nr:Do family serine endopeptidase [Allorhodopirellula heiligendammensis]TWU17060.1 putative periplasmic serine endoprotease DegP-like precursor [Allorhodopirellula heiligendammensis]